MSSKKISEFVESSAFRATDLLNIVRDGTNYKVPFSEFASALGVTGTIVNTAGGTPVLYQPTPTTNVIRSLTSGAGVNASFNASNGITLKHNFTFDSTGEALCGNPAFVNPTIKSIVGASGITAQIVGNTIEISNANAALENRIIVSSASDLSGALDSTKEYFIDGVIDMGSQSITIPSNGLSLSGYGFDISQLTSTQSGYTMFVSGGGGSGNLIGRDYSVAVSGSSSKVYQLVAGAGTEAIEMARVNYNNCTSLGSLSGYRQGLEVGTGRFGGKPELEFIGSWAGGYFIETSIIRGLTDGAYSIFKAGAGFIMSSRFRTNQNIDLPASASFIDFASGNFVNPSTLQLDGCLISRAGVFDASDTNILPNIAASNLISKWSGNDGIDNTFVGGQSVISSESVTTISTPGVYVDLAGTFTSSDLQHFDAPANGQLRHLGTSPREYKVSGQVVIDGGSGDVCAVKIVIFRALTTSFEDAKITTRVINNLQGARDVAYVVIGDNIILNKNDYVKLQVANITDTTDVTAELDSFYAVEAR